MRPEKKEIKKCIICGHKFMVQSRYGNPFKWCEACRVMKSKEVAKIAKENKK